MSLTFDALNAGALSLIEKPSDIMSEGFDVKKDFILKMVRALSEVHVITRRTIKKRETKKTTEKSTKRCKVLALAASTGGPAAFFQILSELPSDFPLPIVIVQHITKGFLPGLIEWLKTKTKVPLKIAEHNEKLQPGIAYFAPEGKHTVINAGESGPVIALQSGPDVDYACPSATVLFNSLAESYPGKSAAGLLTGMGKDGAKGLKAMHQAGCYTFIQSEESSVVFGMPATALKLEAVDDTFDLSSIASEISTLFKGE